jgi:recombination protein RecA
MPITDGISSGPAAVQRLSTGFVSLDKALGIGGLPRGRIVEIFGPESCGKTALALQIAAHTQRTGGAVVWIDAEHSFDPAFAAELGVDVSRLPVAAPDSTEQACEMALRLAASYVLDLVVVDSAAALVPQLELESSIAAGAGGLHSRALGSALRRLAPAAARSGTAVLLLNQTRIRPESAVEQPETSAGGPPLKLYAAARIALAATGNTVRFRIVKNNVAAAFGAGELEWRPVPDGTTAAGPGFVERL